MKVAITALIAMPPLHPAHSARKRLTPCAGCETAAQPIPGWKRIDAIQKVLPQRDRNKADEAGGLISMDEWGEIVMKGNPLA